MDNFMFFGPRIVFLLILGFFAIRFVARMALQIAAHWGSPSAQLLLGCCILEGRLGFKKCDLWAYKWTLLAAEQGEPSAAHNLGVLFCEGRGVSQDLIEGYAWQRCSLELGETMWEQELNSWTDQNLTPDEKDRIDKRTIEILRLIKGKKQEKA